MQLPYLVDWSPQQRHHKLLDCLRVVGFIATALGIYLALDVYPIVVISLTRGLQGLSNQEDFGDQQVGGKVNNAPFEILLTQPGPAHGNK